MLPSVKICLHSFLIFCTSPSHYVALNLLRSNTYCTGSAMKLFSSIIGCWQHNNHNHNRWHQKYMGDPKIFRLQWILSSCALIFCEVSLSSTEFQCKLWETRLSRCNECRLLKTTVWIIIGLYIICSGGEVSVIMKVGMCQCQKLTIHHTPWVSCQRIWIRAEMCSLKIFIEMENL